MTQLLPHQTPPAGPWTTWMIVGARAAGKTYAAAEWFCDRVQDDGRMFIVVSSLQYAKDFLVPAIMKQPRWERGVRPFFEPRRREILFHCGAFAQIFPVHELDAIRRDEFETGWIEDADEMDIPGHQLAAAIARLRVGPDPRMVLTTKDVPTQPLQALARASTTVITQPLSILNSGLSPNLAEALRRQR